MYISLNAFISLASYYSIYMYMYMYLFSIRWEWLEYKWWVWSIHSDIRLEFSDKTNERRKGLSEERDSHIVTVIIPRDN